ncbi:hypothetical protein TNIN_156941 [Trichonephila inaurata madagascariensis]|nr:hypothetical protein TNIN_156941 [Trichonephila inaurata madagascariensis]
MTELMSRNKYNLDDVSLTICSGTDMVNINYTHVVCPDPETAQVAVAERTEADHQQHQGQQCVSLDVPQETVSNFSFHLNFGIFDF